MFTHTPTNSVRIIRDVLDRMEDNQFRWIVYDHTASDVPPALDAEAELTNIWRAVCPLICFDIVEMHRPNCVMRQFGMIQMIPGPALDGDDLHTLTRQGRRNCDWEVYHRQYIEWWQNRRNFVFSDLLHNGVTTTRSGYKRWYEQNTILLLSPAVRGTGFRPGDALLRSRVNDEADYLMHCFDGMSLRDLPPDIAAGIEDTSRVGRVLYELANRTPDHPFRERTSSRDDTRRRRTGSSSRQVQPTIQDSAGPSDRATHVPFNEGSSFTLPPNTSSTFPYSIPPVSATNYDHSTYMYNVPHYSTSPIPYLDYSEAHTTTRLHDGEQVFHDVDVQQEEDPDIDPQQMRRQRRRRVRRRCGTGGHY